MNGNGVDDLKRYLINAAKPNSFDFPGIVYTDDDPRDTVKKIVKAKFLDVLPSDVPYKINPTIQTWSMDSGVLRLGIQVKTKGSIPYFSYVQTQIVQKSPLVTKN